MPRTNSQFVATSLTEFLSVWSMAGDANLNLTTKGGNLNSLASALELKVTPLLRLLQPILLTRPANEALLSGSVIGRELLAIKQPKVLTLQNHLSPALIQRWAAPLLQTYFLSLLQ